MINSNLTKNLNPNKVYHYLSLFKENKIVECILFEDHFIIPEEILLKYKGTTGLTATLRFCCGEWHRYFSNNINSKCSTCMLISRNKTDKMKNVAKNNILSYINTDPRYKETQRKGATKAIQITHQKVAEVPGLARKLALNALSHIKYEKVYCDKCKAYTTHKNDLCIVCNPQIAGNATNKITCFIDNNDCKIHPDCEKQFFDKAIRRYVCWECYKKKFICINFPHNFEGYFWINTFRHSENKLNFEQYLIDNQIKWFVYIKFYYDKENCPKPLVVGKSGSLLVNTSGSDLNFSLSYETPARIFLRENNLEWMKEQILIKGFDSEADALIEEKSIVTTFHLFES